MKKLLSLLLALLMIASAAVLSVSAGITYTEGTILFEDDFEDEKDETFWGVGNLTGLFTFEDGTMNGFDDAKICQSNYKWEPGKAGITTTPDWPCQKEFTEWVDIRVDESADADHYAAGFWIQDGGNADRGYESERTVYDVLYYALDYTQMVMKTEDQGDGTFAEVERPRTSFVRMTSNTERKEKNYTNLSDDPTHNYWLYGELDVPGDPGFNYRDNGEAVKLGVRFGHGNITAYVNGLIVGSYDYETIGTLYTPILLQNAGCYVEFDNYGLGTYEHDVKKMTRNESYELYEGKVTVMDGENVAGEIAAAEDDELKIAAPKVSGRKFVKWDAVSVGGVEITDANREKIELLYGIKIGSLEDEKFEITMPNVDVVLKAVYEDGPDDKLLGDANGDGKVNSKDVVAIMKAIVGVEVKGYTKEAADFDGNGKVNSKDVVALMKYIVTH